MLYTITYLLTLFVFPPESHEVQLARFELAPMEGHLRLEIFVEKEDLNACWANFGELFTDEKKAVLSDYIATHTAWFLNDKPYDICSYNLSSDVNHLMLYGYFNTPPDNIQNIQLNNRFLIQEIPNHINIIHLKLHQRLRSFRMDNKRQKITIEY